MSVSLSDAKDPREGLGQGDHGGAAGVAGEKSVHMGPLACGLRQFYTLSSCWQEMKMGSGDGRDAINKKPGLGKATVWRFVVK